MDIKFYVSYEAARLLKEKGYNELAKAAWCGIFKELRLAPIHGAYRNCDYPDDIKLYAAPTKAEAIDWMDSKGIGISIIFCEIEMYEYVVEQKDGYYSVVESGYKETRLEAEEAAIIKACELLKGKEE